MNVEKKRLVWNAVPTLFDVPNKPPQLTLKRKLPHRHNETSKIMKVSPDPEESCCTVLPIPDPQTVAHDHPVQLTSEASTQTTFEDETE